MWVWQLPSSSWSLFSGPVLMMFCCCRQIWYTCLQAQGALTVMLKADVLEMACTAEKPAQQHGCQYSSNPFQWLPAQHELALGSDWPWRASLGLSSGCSPQQLCCWLDMDHAGLKMGKERGSRGVETIHKYAEGWLARKSDYCFSWTWWIEQGAVVLNCS